VVNCANYRCVIVGVAGFVHGIGVTDSEPIAYRAEPMDEALRKLDPGAPVIDLTNIKQRSRFLAAIPCAPWIDFSLTEEHRYDGRRSMPLAMYVEWWQSVGADVWFKASA